MAGAVTQVEVIDAIGELVEALGAYSERVGREVELILRTDGSLSLMGADGPDGFEEIEQFDSMDEMWAHLVLAEVAV